MQISKRKIMAVLLAVMLTVGMMSVAAYAAGTTLAPGESETTQQPAGEAGQYRREIALEGGQTVTFTITSTAASTTVTLYTNSPLVSTGQTGNWDVERRPSGYYEYSLENPNPGSAATGSISYQPNSGGTYILRVWPLGGGSLTVSASGGGQAASSAPPPASSSSSAPPPPATSSSSAPPPATSSSTAPPPASSSSAASSSSSAVPTNASTIQNPGEVALADLQAMTQTKVNADSMNGNSVDVRITLNPSQATTTLNLSASTVSDAATGCTSIFEKFFSNGVMAVALGQKGSFGMSVQIAARLDADLDTDNLVFYSYDREANVYKKIASPNYSVDQNGFVHFTTTMADNIIISDGELVKK